MTKIVPCNCQLFFRHKKKHRRIGHLQNQEPFYSDPYFSKDSEVMYPSDKDTHLDFILKGGFFFLRNQKNDLLPVICSS